MTARWTVGFLVALCVLAGAGQAWATESAEALLDTARQAWTAGRYAAAGRALEAAYRTGARNVPVCLGAARAWRRAGDPGRFVLWLVRAHRLDPGDPKARKAVNAAGVAPYGPRLPLGERLPPGRLVRLAVAASLAWWLGLILARWRRQRPPVWALVATGLFVGWLWLEAGLGVSRDRLWPQGVVLAETAARCAPEPAAEILFSLPAGRVVLLGPAREGFRRVTAPGDRVGWLPQTAVEAATP